MKTIQEIEQILSEGKVEEGYELLKQYYEKNKDDVSLFYITILDLEINYNEVSEQDFMDRFIKLTKSKNKKIREKIYDPFASFLLDLDDFENCYKYGKKARDEGYHSFLIDLAYAKGEIEYNNNKSKEIENILLQLLDNPPTDQIKELLEKYIGEYYCRFEKYQEAEDFIHKLYFTNKNGLPQYLSLVLATYKNEGESNEEYYEKTINTFYHHESLGFLCDFYYHSKKYEITLKYLDILLKVSNNNIIFQKKKAVCLLRLEKEEEAQKLLLTLDQDDYDVCLLLGQIYISKNTRKAYQESKKYLFKALELGEESRLYKFIFSVCEQTKDKENWEKAINKLEQSGIDLPMLCLSKITYNNTFQNFDEALKILKSIGKFKYYDKYIDQYLYCIENTNKLNKKFKKINKQNEDFFTARQYYYGYHGTKINKKEAEVLIKSFEEKSDSNCVDSLIAKYYLDNNNVDKALTYINRGMQRYNNNEDMCTCIVGYYVYCLMNGIGMEKDIQKAYDIALKTKEENFNVISDSLSNAFAECSILLNKDLNPVYEFLINSIEKRYHISKYYMIIKVGKLLNKDVSYYEEMFKKSFKYEPKLEVEYYKTNPETFMMNNF